MPHGAPLLQRVGLLRQFGSRTSPGGVGWPDACRRRQFPGSSLSCRTKETPCVGSSSYFSPLWRSPQRSRRSKPWVLRPDRLFDGEQLREGWSVLVQGGRITEVGPSLAMPAGGAEIVLSGTTLLPGLIEGHSHLLLHPYNETS